MLDWFTEDSTIPMITGVILTIILLGLAFSSREKSMVYLAVIIGTLTAGTVICERMIVTQQEEIVHTVVELAAAVQANDKDTVITYISPTRPDTIARVHAEMPRYDFDNCQVIGTNYFEPTSDGNATAEICFIVSVRVRIGSSPDTVWGHRKMNLFFEKNAAGKWQVVHYTHEAPSSSVTL